MVILTCGVLIDAASNFGAKGMIKTAINTKIKKSFGTENFIDRTPTVTTF